MKIVSVQGLVAPVHTIEANLGGRARGKSEGAGFKKSASMLIAIAGGAHLS